MHVLASDSRNSNLSEVLMHVSCCQVPHFVVKPARTTSRTAEVAAACWW